MALVSAALSELTEIFPAWRQAASDPSDDRSVKRWAVGYKRQMVKAFYESRIDSRDKVERGLAQARLSDSDFMPSAGKFASWCTPTLIPYHSEFVQPSEAEQLEWKNASPEVRRESIAKCKQLVSDARSKKGMEKAA